MKLNSTKGSLWGQEHDITPHMVDKIWGDGQVYIWLSPMNHRPNYYVVCVDSSWIEHDTYQINDRTFVSTNLVEDIVRDHLDEIWDVIDEEFGDSCCEKRSEGEECKCDETWPACVDPGGWSWGLMDQAEIDELINGLYSDLFIDLPAEPKKKRCSYCGRKKYLGKGKLVKGKYSTGQPYAYWRYQCRYCKVQYAVTNSSNDLQPAESIEV